MIGEIIYLIIFIVTSVAVMIRWRLFSELLLELMCQKILDEISCLKVSAPNLTSTFDGNNSLSA